MSLELDETAFSKSQKPHLAVTLGDPAGIGSEVVLKALGDPMVRGKCQMTLIGDRALFAKAYKHLREQGIEGLADPQNLSILHTPLEGSADPIEWGRGNAASGAASFAYLKTAIARTLKGEFQGIVTAPIAKSLWKAAGYDYPGQTEVLAEAAGAKNYGMLFVARSPHTHWTLRTLLATTHIPLRDVPDALTPQRMTNKLKLFIHSLRKDFGIATPKIAIAGLNPHSGEAGQLGTEEQDWLFPWLKAERRNHPNLELLGLVPPDTLWVNPAQAWYGEDATTTPADGYLALYHDQGLIPVKLMAFDRAVNTTIGLPFIRTSPDHGTAFDIAGQGIARADSMKAAILLAAELSERRSRDEITGAWQD
ncbi:4-hydroxythreonine-4-phosphate dehydrogenase PdxA [Lusitaniella coriacea LEGE 07157]|uniref:4-hydroxythreonine-4-phosphate dehydrogenase n=1 Tax=Lusitaniella coriacea LEGE 07157 TaxID=945747 RepID=A0A8J7DX01_9CYAN|nr:4-hydroxythreonine-4-phosphate dehydrogenase PdxA [Lusitaniella coriacea]MBE9116648.1 4-hydroxythreonine-4-phosphate dehydrogenase PdxA [Lusitaniella coriacea LEGE 07157]